MESKINEGVRTLDEMAMILYGKKYLNLNESHRASVRFAFKHGITDVDVFNAYSSGEDYYCDKQFNICNCQFSGTKDFVTMVTGSNRLYIPIGSLTAKYSVGMPYWLLEGSYYRYRYLNYMLSKEHITPIQEEFLSMLFPILKIAYTLTDEQRSVFNPSYNHSMQVRKDLLTDMYTSNISGYIMQFRYIKSYLYNGSEYKDRTRGNGNIHELEGYPLGGVLLDNAKDIIHNWIITNKDSIIDSAKWKVVYTMLRLEGNEPDYNSKHIFDKMKLYHNRLRCTGLTLSKSCTVISVRLLERLSE